MDINSNGKRVAVIGSRTFTDKERLYKILTKNKERIKLIVSGGAAGADTLATEWAIDYGVPYLVFPALWHDPITGTYDRGAGMRRNRYIVTHSDVLMVFWDGISKGTANSIEIAKQLNKPIKIFTFSAAKAEEKDIPVELPKEEIKTQIIDPKTLLDQYEGVSETL